MKTENTGKRGSGVIIWGVAILSILLGVGIFLYPFISNFFAELSQNKVIDIYKANVEDTSKEEIEAEWEEAKIYNENLSGDPVHDPFIVGSGYAVPDNYDEVLNLDEEGVMCYLEIPKLDLNLPVYHGTSEEVLRKGVGHLEMTALPIGGKNRRTVLTGHRGLPRAELFTRLDEMKLGDEIYIHILDETHAYKVKEIKTVEPEELQNLTITPDGEDLVTLVTCTPYGVNTHRLLVTGERTEYVKKEEKEQTPSLIRKLMPWRYYIIGVSIVIGVFGTGKITMTILRYRKYGKKEKEKKEIMKKAYILGVILIVAGILISQYPKLTDFLFRQEAKEKKEEFEKEKRNSKIKVEELYHELVKRNEALYASRRTGVRDPFLYEQNTIDLSSYGIEDGVVGFVKIDKLNVELPIYLGASEKNMSMGAAHLAETSYPVGGENTNCVIAAHRGFRKTAMFWNIQKLQVGDPVVIENFREVLKYEVSDIEIIEPSQTDKLLIRQGEDMVTLLTCHPYGSNAKRYLVYCKRVN